MKKLLLILMTVMVTTLAAKAQVKPTVLGDKHAMLKVDQGEKYLLLPVQESEDIAAIAVLNGQNEMVQRLNVKLAIDRVDYFVPLKIRNEKLEMSSQRHTLTSQRNEELEMTLRKLGLLEIAGTVMWVLGYLVHGEQFTGHDCRREEWMICEPDERRGRFLLEEIMEGGNFGMGLKSSNGWLSANTAIGRNILRLKRDARLLRYFPSECLWEPIFRLWHFGWRLAH